MTKVLTPVQAHRAAKSIDAATVKADILRVLSQIGPLTVKELELCFPKYSRLRLLSAMQRLRKTNQVHLPLLKIGVKNPPYAFGADPNPRLPGETVEEHEARLYHLSLNPHLKDDWRPAPDLATAWLNNPTTLKEPLHVEH